MLNAFLKNKTNAILFVIIAVATSLAYINVWRAGFISWDDADFTIDNSDVRTFNLKAFFTNFYLGNYPPLTMFSFAVDYMLGKNNPSVYHFTNITLHIINAGLVFLLFIKLQPNRYLAFFTALIFALHPMQTESVSWISERKNVLCALFYFLSLLLYIRYTKNRNQKNYLLVMLAFVAALFSKGMAVSLPVSLLALDLWMKQPINKKVLIEKIPFFVLSFIFGVIAVKAQSSSGFLKPEDHYGILQKFLFSGEAFLSYFLKIIIPYKLSALYPYPTGITVLQVAGLLFFVGAIVALILFMRRQNYLMAGAILFFAGNVIFVLQFVAFGAVLMADHYIYIACLGVIYPIMVLIFSVLKQNKASSAVIIIICLFFGLYTFKRNSIWQNEINFWSDIATKYPTSHIALNSLGAAYMQKGRYAEAHECVGRAISLAPTFYKAYYNNGLIYARENKFLEAMKNFDQAIKINNYPKAIVARGGIYYEVKDFSKAMNDAQTVISIEPNNARAYFLMGNCLNDLNQLDKALESYSKAIEIKSNEPVFFLNRAIVFGKLQHYDNSLNDLEAALRIDPQYAEAYYWKAVVRINLKQSPCEDLQNAVKFGFEQARGPLNKYCN